MSAIKTMIGTTFVSLALLGVVAALARTTEKTELYVRTSPPGAKVLLDGEDVGTSPALFEVEPGAHVVVVKLAGHESKTKNVTIRDGRIKRVILELQKAPEAVSGSEETAWGPAVAGVQCRIRAEKPTWPQGTAPKLFANLRNQGKRKLQLIALEPGCWQVEIDGQWHQTDGYSPPIENHLPLGPGEQLQDREVRIPAEDNISEKLRELRPGKHILRVAKFLHESREGPGESAKRFRVVSNPIEIEILRANHATTKAERPEHSSRGREAIRGRVLDAAGKPVAGAKVFLSGPETLLLIDGKDEFRSRTSAETDAQGRFVLARDGREKANRLIVTAPSLHVWIEPVPRLDEELTIRLPEPAMLVLRYDIEGDLPEVRFRLQLDHSKKPGWTGVVDSVQYPVAKNGGQVTVMLTPGTYGLARLKPLRWRSGEMDTFRRNAFCDQQMLELTPGERKVVDFVRPTGGRILGEVVSLPEDLRKDAFVYVSKTAERREIPLGKRRLSFVYPVGVLDAVTSDETGKFASARIPPGAYTVIAHVYKPGPQHRQSGELLPDLVGLARVTVLEDGEPPKVRIEMTPTSHEAVEGAAEGTAAQWGDAVEGVQSRLRPGVFRNGHQWLSFDLRNDSSNLLVQLAPGGVPREILVDNVAYRWSGRIAGGLPVCKPGQHVIGAEFKLDKSWTAIKTASGPETLELKPGKHTVQAIVYAAAEDAPPRGPLLRVVSNPVQIEIVAAKPAVGDEKTAWGRAVEGVQIRLWVEKKTWRVGEEVILKYDARNQGKRDLVIDHGGHGCVDIWVGRKYSPRQDTSYLAVPAPFGPGQHYEGRSIGTGRRYPGLKLAPGKHTIRIELTAHQNANSRPGEAVQHRWDNTHSRWVRKENYQPPVVVSSNPIEIEIVPADPPAGWDPYSKTSGTSPEPKPGKTEPLSFGPVRELSLSGPQRAVAELLDLETGRRATLKQFSRDDPQTHRWIREHRMDVLGGDRKADEVGLMLFDMAVWESRSIDWEKITAAEVRDHQALAQMKPKTIRTIYAQDLSKLPWTCLFRTREGSLGVLQVVGAHGTRFVWIRYKLVRQAGSSTSASSPADRVGTCSRHPQVNVPKAGKHLFWSAGHPRSAAEQAVRDMISHFVEAVTRNDRASAAKFLSKRSHLVHQHTREIMSEGINVAEIRFVPVAGSRALAVSSLAQAPDPESEKLICVVYIVVKEGDRWVIEDIDLADRNGLSDHIGDLQAEPEPAARSLRTFRHPAHVRCVALSADGKLVAAGGADGTVRFWDAETSDGHAHGSVLTVISRGGRRDRIQAAAFSPDGKTVAAGCLGVVKLFDAVTGKFTVALDDPAVKKEIQQGDTLYHINFGVLGMPLAHGNVKSIAFSPDGTTLATGGGPMNPKTRVTHGTLKLWDAKTGKLKHDLQGHPSWVSSIAFSADGKLLATVGENDGPDSALRLWDLRSVPPKFIRRLSPAAGVPHSIAFSPDGKMIAAGFGDIRKGSERATGYLVAWNAETGAMRYMVARPRPEYCLAFSPDGKTVATAGPANTVTLLDSETGRRKFVLGSRGKPYDWVGPLCMAFSPTGNLLAIGGGREEKEGFVTIWDLGDGQKTP